MVSHWGAHAQFGALGFDPVGNSRSIDEILGPLDHDAGTQNPLFGIERQVSATRAIGAVVRYVRAWFH
jgi:hypothetical protein